MKKNIHEWVELVETVFAEKVALGMTLEQEGALVELQEFKIQEFEIKVLGAVYLVAKFPFSDGVITRIFFHFMDFQTDADIVITNIKTLPPCERGKGFGSQAVQKILAWSVRNNLHEIRATQVSYVENMRFWEKNGFTRCPDPNPHGDHVHYC